MSQLKTKLTAIKADYDDCVDICDDVLGIAIPVYVREAAKIAEQFSTMAYVKDQTGIPLNTAYKMSINPELHPTVTSEEAAEIRTLWNANLAAVKLELHGLGGAGMQFGIADGGIWFSLGKTDISLTWKENWDRTGFDDGPVLAEPYWKIEQAMYDLPEGVITTQETMDSVKTWFDRLGAVNEVYVCQQWGVSYSADSLSTADIENMTKLLNYLVKFIGASFAEVSE